MTGAVRSPAPCCSPGALIKPLWNLGTPSALIDRFEVWVDGRARPGRAGHAPHRGRAARRPAGTPSRSARCTCPADSRRSAPRSSRTPTAPVFPTAPDVALRAGRAQRHGAGPARWTAADVNGLASVRLLRPSAVDLGTIAHGRNGTLRPGLPATFAVQATDRAGNAASASVTRTPVVVSEAAAQRTGSWRPLRNPRISRRDRARRRRRRASATWTFTGRSAALVVGRGADSGRVRIFVDGRTRAWSTCGRPRRSTGRRSGRGGAKSGSHSVRGWKARGRPGASWTDWCTSVSLIE